ncbi:MAG: glycosyltransferase family 4 protein [Winogradskyella sp.]|uniref:glycosyltransferase family 4 protein n=1 Tax=Winogradskyella sp. TaxID=1883156 RepID=UPI0017985909|nr:glycosyltransferase family 4 protein [Winogradskyella sp.]
MNFVIITHVLHNKQGEKLYAYAPYVREMNLWLKHVDVVDIVAPISIDNEVSSIDLPYHHNSINLRAIPQIQFTSFRAVLVSLLRLPRILITLFKACKNADHIHLRCPGNIGLLGCLVQIWFPNKVKTAKYAGNWDPKALQPLSYRIQKLILSSTILTKNISVIVYGKWLHQSKNIKSFFTASFSKLEIESDYKKTYSGELYFVFIGSLVEGKRPLLTIKIIEYLLKKGINVKLDIYGDGVLKNELTKYIKNQGLQNIIKLHGNQHKETIKSALKKSHFTILPSKSEGWPKAIAEGMFFGAIPIATEISCLPWMLDFGNRGVLIVPEVECASEKIINVIEHRDLEIMSRSAQEWAQQYTIDDFEIEVGKLLQV